VLKESSAYSDRRWQIFEIDDWLFAYFEKIHVECHRRTSTSVFLRVNVPSNVRFDVTSWRPVKFDETSHLTFQTLIIRYIILHIGNANFR